jgi:hypothetical protein
MEDRHLPEDRPMAAALHFLTTLLGPPVTRRSA